MLLGKWLDKTVAFDCCYDLSLPLLELAGVFLMPSRPVLPGLKVDRSIKALVVHFT
jgi:hypothetical protein